MKIMLKISLMIAVLLVFAACEKAEAPTLVDGNGNVVGEAGYYPSGDDYDASTASTVADLQETNPPIAPNVIEKINEDNGTEGLVEDPEGIQQAVANGSDVVYLENGHVRLLNGADPARTFGFSNEPEVDFRDGSYKGWDNDEVAAIGGLFKKTVLTYWHNNAQRYTVVEAATVENGKSRERIAVMYFDSLQQFYNYGYIGVSQSEPDQGIFGVVQIAGRHPQTGEIGETKQDYYWYNLADLVRLGLPSGSILLSVDMVENAGALQAPQFAGVSPETAVLMAIWEGSTTFQPFGSDLSEADGPYQWVEFNAAEGDMIELDVTSFGPGIPTTFEMRIATAVNGERLRFGYNYTVSIERPTYINSGGRDYSVPMVDMYILSNNGNNIDNHIFHIGTKETDDSKPDPDYQNSWFDTP